MSAIDAARAKELVREALAPRLFAAGIAEGALSSDSNLVESGLLDSLAFLEMIESLEARAGRELDLGDTDPEVFTTLGGLEALVAQAVGSEPEPDRTGEGA